MIARSQNPAREFSMGSADSSRFIKNYLYLVLSQALTYAINFGIALIIARRIGVHFFGEFFLLATIQGFFLLLADSGINTIYLREASKNSAIIGKYLNNIIPLKVLLFLCAYLLMQLFVLSFGYPGQIVRLSLVFGLSLLPFSINSLAAFTFRAIGRMDKELLSNAFNAMVAGLLILWLCLGKVSTQGVVLAWVSVHALSMIFNFYMLKKTVYFRFRFETELWGYLLSESKYFLLYTLTSWFYVQVDTVIISKYLPASEVGYYQAAVKILAISAMLADVMLNTSFPFIIRKYFTDPDQGKRLITRMSELTLMLVWPIILVVIFFSREVVFTLYGGQFERAAAPLFVLGLGYLFYYGPPYGLTLAYLGHQKINFLVSLFCAVANMILNLYLIPRHGILGAAIATAVTYAGLKIAYIVIFSRIRFPIFSFSMAKQAAVMLLPLVALKVLATPLLFCLPIYFLFIGSYMYKKFPMTEYLNLR
ncbi:MAG: flippase [Desulfurivibrionaceae bacterium]